MAGGTPHLSRPLWAVSSVGQSTTFAMWGSRVRISHSPLRLRSVSWTLSKCNFNSLTIKIMACFLAPAAAAIVTTSIRKKIPKNYHIGWLNSMLWGGVIMFAVEHYIHGEIVLFPPFLTALKSPADTLVMLKEIATIGSSMTAVIIVVWAIMVLISNIVAKKHQKRLINLSN